jgi:hypothetical protein
MRRAGPQHQHESGALLRDAILTRANLMGARLGKADLGSARRTEGNLAGVDFGLMAQFCLAQTFGTRDSLLEIWPVPLQTPGQNGHQDSIHELPE